MLLIYKHVWDYKLYNAGKTHFNIFKTTDTTNLDLAQMICGFNVIIGFQILINFLDIIESQIKIFNKLQIFYMLVCRILKNHKIKYPKKIGDL